jgi:hypothetical protein
MTFEMFWIISINFYAEKNILHNTHLVYYFAFHPFPNGGFGFKPLILESAVDCSTTMPLLQARVSMFYKYPVSHCIV